MGIWWICRIPISDSILGEIRPKDLVNCQFWVDLVLCWKWLQLQGIWWVWRDWSCLEPSEALWFLTEPWRSREALLWNSFAQNIEAPKCYEVLHFLGWYFQEKHQFCYWDVHFWYPKTVSATTNVPIHKYVCFFQILICGFLILSYKLSWIFWIKF